MLEDPKLEDELFTELEKDFISFTVEDIEAVTSIESMALLSGFSRINKELKELDEVYFPHTDKGRELHSKRAAFIIELKQRGVL